MYGEIVEIKFLYGVHMRVAAEIVHQAEVLKGRFSINLYIRKLPAKEPIAISMLALLALKIKAEDKIEICCLEDNEVGKIAVHEMTSFISSEIVDEKLTRIDAIMEENNIANEQILQSIPVGILVIDINSCIVFINEYGLRFTNKDFKQVLGRKVMDIIPSSDLPAVMQSRKKHSGQIQHINESIVIANRSPIFSEGSVIGAIAIFQDISELVGMKELNEKLKKILEASHDLICFVDANRRVSYINPAYEAGFGISSKDVVGKDINILSPTGLRMKVFDSKKKIENLVYQKENVEIVATVQPLFIDGDFQGVISISKPVNEIRFLIDKLHKSEAEANYYKEELERYSGLSGSFNNIIGVNGSLRECLYMAQKAAKSTSTVIVRGESGTGKELLAKAIHNESTRKDKPFIRVNCAAIPENLLESELFGYEKGAFTGAVKSKPGKFNLANGGTIFLDEIGDMPKPMQVKLLRVLQEKEFESVGGIITQKVDVRVIAATNRNLEEMMKNGEFREDLYYRLNVIPIVLPPLKERKEDINLLVEHFIKKLSEKLGKTVIGIDETSLKLLGAYEWPGNIRELENVIERAINFCDDNYICVKDLPIYISSLAFDNADFQTAASVDENNNMYNISNMESFKDLALNDGDALTDFELKTMEEYERDIILLALKKYKSFNKAGKALGLTHRTISLKCKKYGIEK